MRAMCFMGGLARHADFLSFCLSSGAWEFPRAFSPRGDYRVGMTVPIPKDTKSATILKRQYHYRSPKTN